MQRVLSKLSKIRSFDQKGDLYKSPFFIYHLIYNHFMEYKLIGKNIHFYSKDAKPKVMAVFSHSLSGSRQSNIILEVSKKLQENNIAVALYDFSFKEINAQPSQNLLQEVKDLSIVISEITLAVQPQKIVLVGNSLGGIVNAVYVSKNKNKVIDQLFILGFPFKIGFPPNFQLLKEQNPVLPDYKSEYRNLFKLIDMPVTIIQGDRDDLGEVEECKDFFKEFKNCNLYIVKDANHGFVSPENKEVIHYYDCAKLIIDKI